MAICTFCNEEVGDRSPHQLIECLGRVVLRLVHLKDERDRLDKLAEFYHQKKEAILTQLKMQESGAKQQLVENSTSSR